MKKRFGIGFLSLIVVLSHFGCTSYRINRATDKNLPLKIDRQAGAYVSIPEDGRTNLEIYQGSGMATAQIIMNEFSKYLSHVITGKKQQTYDDALKSALYAGYRYLIYPSIGQWEDQATEVTEIRDKVKLKMIVVDTLSGEQIDSVMISGKSKLFTTGGEQPQDLLETPIRIYVKTLFD